MDTLIYALLSKKISEITVDVDKKLVADVEFSYDSTSGELGIILKNDAGETVAETSIDLPIEKIIEHAYYDADTKELVFELVGGDIVRVPVGDLIADLKQDLDEHIADDSNPHHVTATQVGLGNVANLAPADLPVSDATQAALNNKQDIIDSENKLSADLVDDDETNNKFVTASDKATWNAKYDKPNSGIPDADIASAATWNAKQDTINDLQTIREGAALGATALQEIPSEYITETELSNYHDATKQDVIDNANKLNADLVDDSSSTNKFTNAEDITKLSNIEAGAQVNVIETVNLGDTPLEVTNKAVTIELCSYEDALEILTEPYIDDEDAKVNPSQDTVIENNNISIGENSSIEDNK